MRASGSDRLTEQHCLGWWACHTPTVIDCKGVVTFAEVLCNESHHGVVIIMCWSFVAGPLACVRLGALFSATVLETCVCVLLCASENVFQQG